MLKAQSRPLGGSEPMYEEVASARKDLPQQKGLPKTCGGGQLGEPGELREPEQVGGFVVQQERIDEASKRHASNVS